MMPTQFKRPNAAADLVMIIMLAAASSVSAWTMGRIFLRAGLCFSGGSRRFEVGRVIYLVRRLSDK